MIAKKPHDDELRMPADEFDRIMRGVLSVPPKPEKKRRGKQQGKDAPKK